ncbi:substrate-binding domain-containing protein [Homoserinibacter sp. GY 40078]|uniref:sugar ABC transporter substrate-binding protein n=1 Tax=Homoserinibacter sp. GY 40078 TaxID=2603275 RepID=UPI00164F22B0|nr:substrate-binding domain-containing protein [Homoserinibacter sp. GY 40078]
MTKLLVAASFLFALLMNLEATPAVTVWAIIAWFLDALFEGFRRREPKKRIIFVGGTDDDIFETNLLDGFRESIRSVPGELTVSRPPLNSPRTEFQKVTLASEEAKRAHALVIIPAHDSDEIWSPLADFLRRGTAVVVLDIKPPSDYFRSRGAPDPIFVASDFEAGGTLAGQALVERLRQDPTARAHVLIGPMDSHPGAGRSARVMLALSDAKLLPRVTTTTLKSWSNDHVSEPIEDIRRQLSDSSGRLVVFAADDRTALTIARKLKPKELKRTSFVGYDGTTSSVGKYVISQAGVSFATVDTDARGQGRDAAVALTDVYNRRWPVARVRLTPPKIVPFQE